MNMKAAYSYQIDDSKKSIMIYYLVVALIIVFFGISISLSDTSNFQSSGGIETSTAIFLFVLGLNSFKETFLMLLQNGVSRKTMFFSRLIASGIICSGMMVIDRIIVNIISGLTRNNPSFHISGLYEDIFYNRAKELGFLQKNAEGILLTLCLYFLTFSLGYFITTAYYRMSKAAKIAVSVGLPTGFFFVLPIVDATITNGRISRFIGYMLGTILGLKKDHPYNFLLSAIVGTVLFLSFSWLLIRRSVDKR